jgi:hypothetical protein
MKMKMKRDLKPQEAGRSNKMGLIMLRRWCTPARIVFSVANGFDSPATGLLAVKPLKYFMNLLTYLDNLLD